MRVVRRSCAAWSLVGSQVGAELRDQGGIAVLVALLGILIYVAVRFQYKFALGAALAVTHDVIITVGFFALFGYEVDLTVLAAVLMVIGYSINDTIVVFDRVRKNFRHAQRLSRRSDESVVDADPGAHLADVGRHPVRGAGAVFCRRRGAAQLRDCAHGRHRFRHLLFIYVASVLALELGVRREDLLLPVKDSKEFDGLP